jgi:glucose/arabinose dehydrogenase/mono/diheme cytochrome c family protein
MAKRLTCSWLVLLCAACSGALDGDVEGSGQGIQLNPGFSHEIVATGFRSPTAMVVAPDGRIFITEQTGAVRVVKNRQLLATPFVSLAVDSGNERGLVGITLDPEFAQNGFVYLFYTTTAGGVHNRVSRFTAMGDVAQPGSELVLVDFPGLSSASNHNAGALNFGADGKLYVAHGDNANTDLAQDLNHPFGKLLRFNRDGSIPADNPFHELPVDVADAIWAYGLRNPFTVAVSPASGRIFANDVGGGDPEEINAIVRGGNFGHGGGANRIGPVHSYPRSGRCAITGGTFYEPGVLNFPSSYRGKYFFADFCAGEIWFMNQDGTGVTSFARVGDGHLHNPVDLDVGLDGSLYYLQRGNGEKLGRIFVPQPDCTSDTSCGDGNVCNGVERCVSSRCQAGTPLGCDDGDACTANSCDPLGGCRNPDNGLCNCTSDAQCDDGDGCTDDRCVSRMCQSTQNGSCSEDVLALRHVSDGGGFQGVAALTDNNLEVKVGSATSPNCIVYELAAPATVTSARLMEDNAGSWHVDAWKLQVDTGMGLRDAVAYSDTPNAMPAWNELRFASISGVQRVAVCLQNDGPVEASELQVRGRLDGPSEPRCGDGSCGGGETCASCASDCGACTTGPLPLRLTRQDGGWSSAAGLTDGDLVTKVSTGTSPNCLDYTLPAPSTVRAARLLEDNDGGWHVDSWKVQLDSGSGFRDATAYTATPRAMPTWNELSFAAASGVTAVRVCMQNDGPIEAAELEVLGEPGGASECGDRVCDAGEGCGSCPWDCGTCPGAPGLDVRPRNERCLAGPPGTHPPALLSQHPCLRSVAQPPRFADGVLAFDINEPFWSDGAVKTRFVALPDGTALEAAADGDITLPPGAVTIKHFTLQGVSIETRFFVRHDDGSYGAYTYRWNDAQNEAELVDPLAGASRSVAGQDWSYPTRGECFECHHEAAGFSLGLEVVQLARPVRYEATGREADQVQTLVALGMLRGTTTPSPLPRASDEAASLALRARAYLHANCGYCHRPGGPGYGLADYRYGVPFSAMRACNESSILAAYPGFDLIEPGEYERSVVWLRMNMRGEGQMPPLASSRVDAAGAALISSYIEALEGCVSP